MSEEGKMTIVVDSMPIRLCDKQVRSLLNDLNFYDNLPWHKNCPEDRLKHLESALKIARHWCELQLEAYEELQSGYEIGRSLNRETCDDFNEFEDLKV